jgi:hypothetical protein
VHFYRGFGVEEGWRRRGSEGKGGVFLTKNVMWPGKRVEVQVQLYTRGKGIILRFWGRRRVSAQQLSRQNIIGLQENKAEICSIGH